MNIAITGASGFIGRNLAARLTAEGHSTRAISLRSGVAPDALAGCDAVVNLAGEPVAQRWTASAKKKILGSRVDGTRALVRALAGLGRKPPVLVSASAVGYYGSRGDETLGEAAPQAADFLGEVSVAWEREALEAEKLGIRVVCPRIGVVLGRGGGALQKMLPPFKLGVGGRIGNGNQWMSWIHIDDLVNLIVFALSGVSNNAALSGPVNAVAPNPVTNAAFTRELARALHRPAIFPVPEFALKLMFGEMASLLLGGQRVIPQAALAAGFQFRYSELGSALAALFGSHRTSATPSA
ncbi:MAG TPA: TIGR01777 family oxidoreductase [Bryobacteraceae bacterium]|nr:TIGR01777 family oxidoreductase [Bryobacteraceae bacterium]